MKDVDALFPLRAEEAHVVVAGIEVALHVLAHAGVFVGDLLAELDDRLDVVLGVVGEEVLEDQIGVTVPTRQPPLHCEPAGEHVERERRPEPAEHAERRLVARRHLVDVPAPIALDITL